MLFFNDKQTHSNKVYDTPPPPQFKNEKINIFVLIIPFINTIIPAHQISNSNFLSHSIFHSLVTPQQWVFGGYCRQTKECFMYPAEDRSAATLLPIIANSVVLPGSNVHSDLWRAYNGAGAMGFQHFTVNRS